MGIRDELARDDDRPRHDARHREARRGRDGELSSLKGWLARRSVHAGTVAERQNGGAPAGRSESAAGINFRSSRIVGSMAAVAEAVVPRRLRGPPPGPRKRAARG